MASRRITDCSEAFYPKALALTQAWEEAGIHYVVICTLRSDLEQAALYAQGRIGLATVNILRDRAGLPKIGEAQNRYIVTCAKPGESNHNAQDDLPGSNALDALALDGGKVIHDGEDETYLRMGSIAEGLGIEWAGRWRGKLRESCHFQLGDDNVA